MENIDQHQIEEPQGTPRVKIVQRNAIAVSLIYMVVASISHMFREQAMNMETGITLLIVVIFLGGILITQHQVRFQTYMGFMDFSKAMGTGMLFVLYYAVIVVIFDLLFNTLIAPDALAEQKELLYHDMSKEDVDKTKRFFDLIFTPVGAAVMGLVSNLFFGLLLSLVGSAITSRNK